MSLHEPWVCAGCGMENKKGYFNCWKCDMSHEDTRVVYDNLRLSRQDPRQNRPSNSMERRVPPISDAAELCALRDCDAKGQSARCSDCPMRTLIEPRVPPRLVGPHDNAEGTEAWPSHTFGRELGDVAKEAREDAAEDSHVVYSGKPARRRLSDAFYRAQQRALACEAKRPIQKRADKYFWRVFVLFWSAVAIAMLLAVLIELCRKGLS